MYYYIEEKHKMIFEIHVLKQNVLLLLKTTK